MFDVAKAREFYVAWLGFGVEWEHRFEGVSPVYMQITRAGCVLHLTEHYGDCCPGTTVFFWMRGIEAFHKEITEKNYGYMRPGLQRTFYDSLCVEVIDPFGNKLRFNERLPTQK